MTTMIREIYEALREAGISEERASAAAAVLVREFVRKSDLDRLATKEDHREFVAELTQRLQALQGELKQVPTALSGVEVALKQEIQEMRAVGLSDVKTDLMGVKDHMSHLQGELSAIKVDLSGLKAALSTAKWVIAAIGFGTLLLLIKAFLPPFPP